MHYDFIEIGTSNFDTLAISSPDDQLGIVVEPIKRYIDSLPDRENVIKVNAAISMDGNTDDAKIYYIPEEIIDSNSDVPFFFKGCNSLNEYHPLHLEHDLKHLVKIDVVPCMTILDLFKKYDVESVTYLQTDTEGADAGILTQLQNYMLNDNTSFRPKRIKFEAKYMSQEDQERILYNFIKNMNYIAEEVSYDITLRLN